MRNNESELALFIRELRSNEANFEKLYDRLQTETLQTNSNRLREVKEKWAEQYRNAREKNSNAWPEYEQFVNEFEKAVLELA